MPAFCVSGTDCIFDEPIVVLFKAATPEEARRRAEDQQIDIQTFLNRDQAAAAKPVDLERFVSNRAQRISAMEAKWKSRQNPRRLLWLAMVVALVAAAYLGYSAVDAFYAAREIAGQNVVRTAVHAAISESVILIGIAAAALIAAVAALVTNLFFLKDPIPNRAALKELQRVAPAPAAPRQPTPVHS